MHCVACSQCWALPNWQRSADFIILESESFQNHIHKIMNSVLRSPVSGRCQWQVCLFCNHLAFDCYNSSGIHLPRPCNEARSPHDFFTPSTFSLWVRVVHSRLVASIFHFPPTSHECPVWPVFYWDSKFCSFFRLHEAHPVRLSWNTDSVIITELTTPHFFSLLGTPTATELRCLPFLPLLCFLYPCCPHVSR